MWIPRQEAEGRRQADRFMRCAGISGRAAARAPQRLLLRHDFCDDGCHASVHLPDGDAGVPAKIGVSTLVS